MARTQEIALADGDGQDPDDEWQSIIQDMLNGKVEYCRASDGSTFLKDVDGGACRDVCDVCLEERAETDTSQWYTCEQCVGLDVCLGCLPTIQNHHPHPLVARPAPSTDASASEAQIIEACWSYRMHGMKLAE